MIILCFKVAMFSCITRNFLKAFLESGDLNKQSSRKRKRKEQQGKISRFFSWKLLKIVFEMTSLTHGWPQSGQFFQKLGHSFAIFEEGHGRPTPLLPLVTQLTFHVI